MTTTPIYSIVIPLKDEEGNVYDLISEIVPTMDRVTNDWELICIDDGSTDDTLTILLELKEKLPQLRIISFNGNYGQSSAFSAGFEAARGEFVITLDGDRQNDPSDIPSMIAAIQDADMVCGIRQKRQDTLFKKVISRIANWVRSRFCHDGVQDTGCSLKIYRKKCLDRIKMYHGMHRFLPALFLIEGFSIKEVPVKHRERATGKTKYNIFNRSFNTIADMFAVRWMFNRRLQHKIQKEIS